MDWPEEMTKALKYIEDNLSVKINPEEIAKRANCSSYNFQRLFSFVTGLSLGYYIRRRVISEALKDLTVSKMSVTDVSNKYGYDSLSSFTRAFKQIEGISPLEATKPGAEITSISPFYFEVHMKGLNEMKFRLEKEDGMTLHGFSDEFNNADGINYLKIPQMWNKYLTNGELCNKLNADNKEVFGVCYDFSENCSKFRYMIGVKGESKEYEELKIKPQLYAKFACLGSKDLQETTKKIFSEWLPQSKYAHADSPELEYYPPHSMEEELWPCEIWIPVIEK